MPPMRRLFPAVLALVLCALSAEGLELTVYHTNDIHGWILPRPASFYERDPSRPIGGAAAFAAVVKKDKGPKLVLDAGDWFQGTPEGTLSKGRALVDVFNTVPYDAVAVGNHDYDLGEANLRELVAASKVPVLAANVYRQAARVPYLKPWIVKEIAGVKVGIFGLITSNMRNLSFARNIAGLEFRREVGEARAAVKALRAAGATVVIALTHVGFEPPDGPSFEGDQTLATEVEGIDLIVGGHTHTALKQPVKDATHGTLIVQAGTTLSSAGVVTLEIDPATKRVVSSRGRLMDLWLDEIGEDPALAAVVARYKDATDQAFSVVLATAAAAMRRDRDRESPLGSWMADCARVWAGADVFLQNGGGIRADLAAGPVTLRDLFNLMPFDNRVVKLTMSGRQISDVLDHGVGMGRIAQISGARVRYRRSAPRGKRLGEVLVGGKPLDPRGTYTLATLDFLVQGGDGYSVFSSAAKKEYTNTLMRDVLRECALEHPLIEAPAPGRLQPTRE